MANTSTFIAWVSMAVSVSIWTSVWVTLRGIHQLLLLETENFPFSLSSATWSRTLPWKDENIIRRISCFNKVATIVKDNTYFPPWTGEPYSSANVAGAVLVRDHLLRYVTQSLVYYHKFISFHLCTRYSSHLYTSSTKRRTLKEITITA